jgi:outer membrane protein assembly factor BamB
VATATFAFQNFSDIGQGLPPSEEDPYHVYTALIGDRAYLAYEREDKRLEATAAQASTAKQLWNIKTDGTSDQWAGITALPDALVVLAHEPRNADPRKLAVLDPADGKQLWDREIRGNDSLLYFDSMLVLVDQTGNKLLGLNPRTGNEEWRLDSPKDDSGYGSTVVYPVTTAEDLGGAATASSTAPLPVRGDKPRIVQIGADDSARVIDVTGGTILKTATGVANDLDLVVAHDGRLFVAPNDGGYQVVTYDLEQMGTPATLFKAADDKHHPDQLVPCGSERICLLDKTSSDLKANKLIALDAKKGGEVWSKDVPDADLVVPVGEHVLVRTNLAGHQHRLRRRRHPR